MQQNHLTLKENGMQLTQKVLFSADSLRKLQKFCAENISLVINADKVKLTGKKYADKLYHKHTGWIGGIKETTAGKVLSSRFPERVVIKAVERMISRNPMGRQQMTKLKVYAGAEHPHTAQNPIVWDIAAMNPKNKRSAL